METKVIGFCGCDSHDIILYLSRILVHMGKKVLMIDYSESKALSSCIPKISGIDSINDFVEYRKTDFTEMEVNYFEQKKYDVVLISFGFKDNFDALNCDKVIYVTNKHKHNILRLMALNTPKEAEKILLYRDKIAGGVSSKHNISLLSDQVQESKRYVLKFSKRDIKSMFQVEYNPIFKFEWISSAMEDFLFEAVSWIYPDMEDSKLYKAALRKAERGE